MEKPPTPEKQTPMWREIRAGDIEETRNIISLGSERSRSEPFYPDEATLRNIRYEGLILERNGEILGYIRLVPPILPAGIFPDSTMVINFVYIRESETNPDMDAKTLDAIRAYARKRGALNIGWFDPDTDMHRITGRLIFNGDPRGAVSIPIASLNNETLERILAHAHAGSGSVN